MIGLVQEHGEAHCYAGIMVGGILGGERWGHIAQQVSRPRCGTVVQEQPRSLQVRYGGDAAQQSAVFSTPGREGALDECICAKGSAADDEALAVTRQ